MPQELPQNLIDINTQILNRIVLDPWPPGENKMQCSWWVDWTVLIPSLCSLIMLGRRSDASLRQSTIRRTASFLDATKRCEPYLWYESNVTGACPWRTFAIHVAINHIGKVRIVQLTTRMHSCSKLCPASADRWWRSKQLYVSSPHYGQNFSHFLCPVWLCIK